LIGKYSKILIGQQRGRKETKMQEKSNQDYWIVDKNLEWYKRQFKNPYRITVAFEKFLTENVNLNNQRILDVGCGAGSALAYIAEKHKDSRFTGIDINTKLFQLFEEDLDNIKFEKADCFNLSKKYINQFDGVISLQTLSWLPEYQRPLEQICMLNPKWIAASSLFYDGKINYTISIENYERPTSEAEFSKVNYNICSVPIIREMLRGYGYIKFCYSPFEIDIDISKPEHSDLGYYTVKTRDDKRLAFNTCLFQPEGFIFASK